MTKNTNKKDVIPISRCSGQNTESDIWMMDKTDKFMDISDRKQDAKIKNYKSGILGYKRKLDCIDDTGKTDRRNKAPRCS